MLTLRSTWTKTLRDYRAAILIWGFGLGLAVVLTLASYDMMGAASRAATAQYAATFRFLGEPVALDTAAGYATWHTTGLLPVMLAIWTVLAGARLVRGDEERGEMDILLSTPASRLRQYVERLAAFVIAVLLIAIIMSAVTVIGEPVVGMPVGVGGALLMSLNVALTALVFGLTATLLAHLFRHRAAAASIAGGFVVLSYLVNATGRIMDSGEWLRRFSPLYYHDLSKPLIPSYGASIGAFLVLAGAALCSRARAAICSPCAISAGSWRFRLSCRIGSRRTGPARIRRRPVWSVCATTSPCALPACAPFGHSWRVLCGGCWACSPSRRG